jgi:hypothetical protein
VIASDAGASGGDWGVSEEPGEGGQFIIDDSALDLAS